MENVPGILTIGNNSVIAEISEKLSKLDYDVSVRVLSARNLGRHKFAGESSLWRAV